MPNTCNAQVLFVGSREVRRIPKGWQHPRDGQGRYKPLLPANYWSDETIAPEQLMRAVLPGEPYEIAAYETVSEGTPISPPFPDTPEGRSDLVYYCAANATTFGNHTADGEAWAAILFGDGAISADGSVVADG